MDKVKIVIADDHHILLDGLKALLGKREDIEITGLYDNGNTLFDELKNTQPDVAIVDINMPHIGGRELTVKIKEFYPQISVVVLSMHDDTATIMSMVDAGISGYLLKNASDKELIEALHTVKCGRMYFSPEVSEKITSVALNGHKKPDAAIEPRLTDRELEILKLISEEYSNAQIAEMLFISERTVETHRKNMLRKTNNKTIVGLMKYALQHQLI